MNGWIKICGVRDALTARTVCEAGADACGLNFYSPSARSIGVSAAATVVKSLAETKPVLAIGLFVNHSLEEIEQAVSSIGLTAIQLHGDETPEFVRCLTERHPMWQVFKAFRVGDSLQSVSEFVAACRRLSISLAGCFLDAKVDGAFGGTGRVAPWELIARDYDRENWPPLILAGGLTPANVADAIRIVRPWGVDTASGVESSPGIKETKLIHQFVTQARNAFDSQHQQDPPLSRR